METVAQSNGTYVKWTQEEWESVARRAKAVREAKPEMPWLSIVLCCQDDIELGRRRFSFNKLSTLRPMFDILDLTEEGNPKPPPPPPPEPERLILQLPHPASPPAPTPTSLSAVSSQDLVSELTTRMTDFKGVMVQMLGIKKDIESIVTTNDERVTKAMARVDEVEKLLVEGLNSLDLVAAAEKKVMACYDGIITIGAELREQHTELYKQLGIIPPEKRKEIGDSILETAVDRELICREAADVANAKMELANKERTVRRPTLRFLLVGPFPKDLPRIQEKLPKTLAVELIVAENSDREMPANAHYCLVSGHADFTRRWQMARTTYGDAKCVRMENGSIGTYAHKIIAIASSHNSQHQ